MPSRTSRLSSAGLVIALLPFMASSAIAATITYDEAVDGDLPSIEWAPLELGIGVNSVTGRFGNGTSTDSADVDAFSIRFAPGQVLESATLSWSLGCTSCPPGGDSGFSAGWQNQNVWYVIGPGNPAPEVVDATMEIRAPQAPLLIPLDSTFRSAFAAPTVPPVHYTWTFAVVPAPGGIWLLGTALLAAAARGVAGRKRDRG